MLSMMKDKKLVSLIYATHLDRQYGLSLLLAGSYLMIAISDMKLLSQ
jgi:hypothetical protein